MALVHPNGYSRESSESRLLPLDNEVQDPLGDLFDFDQIMATEPPAPDQDMSSTFPFGDGAPLFNTNGTLDYLHSAANDVPFPPSTHFDYSSMFPSLNTALPGAASAVSAASALRNGCDPTLSQAAVEKPPELAHEHSLPQSAAAPALAAAAASGLPATPPLTPSTRGRKKQERTTPASASPTAARSLRWKPSTSGPRVSRKRAGGAKRKTESPAAADRAPHKAKVYPPVTAPANQQSAKYAAAAAAAAASTPTAPPRFGLLGNGFAPLSPPPSGRAPSGGFPAPSPLLGGGGMMLQTSLIALPMSSPSDGTFRSPDIPEAAAFSPNFFTDTFPGGSQPGWSSPGPTMGGVLGQPLNMSNGFSAAAAPVGAANISHRAGPALVGHESPASQTHGWWHLDGVNQSFFQLWSEQRDSTRLQETSQRMMEMMTLSTPDVANFATSGLMISCADDDLQNMTSKTTTTMTAMGNGFNDNYDLVSPTAASSGFVLPTAVAAAAAAAHMPSSPPSAVPPRTPSPLGQQQRRQSLQHVPGGSAVDDDRNGDHTATTAKTTGSAAARGRRPRNASARSPRRPSGRPPGRPRGSRASQQGPAATADQDSGRLGLAGVSAGPTSSSGSSGSGGSSSSIDAQLPPAVGQIPLPMPPFFSAHPQHQMLLSSPLAHPLVPMPNSSVPYLTSPSALQRPSQAHINHDAAAAAAAAATTAPTAAATQLLPFAAPYNAIDATEPMAAVAQNPANKRPMDARQAHLATNPPNSNNNSNYFTNRRRNRSSQRSHHDDNTTTTTTPNGHRHTASSQTKHSNSINSRRAGGSGVGGGVGGKGKGRAASASAASAASGASTSAAAASTSASASAASGAASGAAAARAAAKAAAAAAAAAGASAQPPPAALDFVNFTPHDRSVILSAVAPSGSSKTKARREKEAADRRRKLSAAAVRAVQAAGGDLDVLRSEASSLIL